MVRTTASGISGPADLAGKTVGELGIYGQDSGVSAKGILMDEYGFKPEQCRWVIGGLDRPLDPCDFVPRPHPADVEVTVAPDGKALGRCAAIETCLRYHVEQGLSERRWTVQEVFAPDLLGTGLEQQPNGQWR